MSVGRRMQAVWSVLLLIAAEAHSAAAPRTPSPPEESLPVAAPADVGLDPRPLRALRGSIGAGRFPRTTSVLLIKDGRLVVEEYFEGGGGDVLNDTRSATKSVTSLAVGAALADGKIRSVSEPAFGLLGDLAPFAHDGPLKGIRKVEWSRSPSGEAMTGGGLRLRSRDLEKLALMVLAEGRWHGRQVVPGEWIRQALKAHRQLDAGQDYGYLFWRRDYRTRCGRVSGWYMSGNGGNAVVMVPGHHLAAIVTRVHYNSRDMHRQTVALLEDHVFAALKCGDGGPPGRR